MSSVKYPAKPGHFKRTIHQSFTSYLKHATDTIRKAQSKGKTDKGLVEYINPPLQLQHLVERSEKSKEFATLSHIVTHTLAEASQGNVSERTIETNASSIVRIFLRRSHFYLRAFRGEREEFEDILNRFCSEIFCRRVKTARLRLLANVRFASRCIDCDIFKIQKFTEKELADLADTEANKIFYPESVLDSTVASQYWFLVEETFSDYGTGVKAGITDIEKLFENVHAVYPAEVPDRVIQLLATHDWAIDLNEEEREEIGVDEDTIRAYCGFTLPFSFSVHNDIFSSPHSIPAFLQLELGSVDHAEDTDVNQQQELELKEHVKKGQKLLKVVQSVKPSWDFIEVAIGYLGRALLTDRNLDQILWNVAVLDSLLSEKSEVMRSLKRRIGNILGATEEQKKQIRKEFDELYDFRSDLVHGNPITKRARYHHLGRARELARQVMVWFVDYLLWVDKDYRKRGLGCEHYPKRNELLAALDFDGQSLNRFSQLLQRLPTGFPTLK